MEDPAMRKPGRSSAVVNAKSTGALNGGRARDTQAEESREAHIAIETLIRKNAHKPVEIEAVDVGRPSAEAAKHSLVSRSRTRTFDSSRAHRDEAQQGRNSRAAQRFRGHDRRGCAQVATLLLSW
ncbi:hypothetical protein MRB53_041374 [Persea americana]|nr:hypothetical protein MRB53_041374 [Persea americana]